MKIRDLFQRLDSLCAGGFPKSLFDSEGQIDSEDVGEHFLIYLMFRDEILIICAYLDMIFFLGGITNNIQKVVNDKILKPFYGRFTVQNVDPKTCLLIMISYSAMVLVIVDFINTAWSHLC